jgi:7-keto-8-aminopelargonate synthetase-like enzyme
VTGERRLIDWLFNRARPYVFSTAPPAAVCAAALAALRVVRDEPHRRIELRQNATRLRDVLREEGWWIGPSASQIIPLIVGDPRQALRWADRLQTARILVPAIRPPTVPAGGALLRISLTCLHSEVDRQQLVEHLGRLRNQADSAPPRGRA